MFTETLTSQNISINKTRKLFRQRAWVEIDHTAIIHNVREMQKLLSPQTQLMAVIKADAYGHGAVSVAKTILTQGVTWLAIATLTEGIELRESGITAPILVLGALNTPEEVEALLYWNLEPTLCNLQQALIFSQTVSQLQTTLLVHLKIDTGMTRLGTSYLETLEFCRSVQALPGLKIVSLYSHLATADAPNLAIMEQQKARFTQAISQLKAAGLEIPLLHIANSAATLTNSNVHYDLVRVGLCLYGLYPAPHLESKINLQPVLQVKARITQVKQVPAGTGVSYGHQFISDRPLIVATVGIGYADGIPRNLSNKLKVLLRGQWVQQIGAITMDQLMLDVTDLENVQQGEIITLIGNDGEFSISAQDWANQLGTISWEILCSFKHRLPRVNLNEGTPSNP